MVWKNHSRYAFKKQYVYFVSQQSQINGRVPRTWPLTTYISNALEFEDFSFSNAKAREGTKTRRGLIHKDISFSVFHWVRSLDKERALWLRNSSEKRWDSAWIGPESSELLLISHYIIHMFLFRGKHKSTKKLITILNSFILKHPTKG